MKKIDLIEAVSKEIKITRSEAKQSIEIILEEISSAIVSGKGLRFAALVVFKKDTERAEWELIQRLEKRPKLMKNLCLFLSLESY